MDYQKRIAQLEAENKRLKNQLEKMIQLVEETFQRSQNFSCQVDRESWRFNMNGQIQEAYNQCFGVTGSDYMER